MALPALVWNGDTKLGNDVLIYANYDTGIVRNRLPSGDAVTVCNGATCPSGSFDATVMTTPGINAFGSMPANAPMFQAVEGTSTPSDAGVFADLVCLPNPTNDFLICYDQSFEATPGATFRAIPRKYDPADHYVRQRTLNTIRISDLFIANTVGLKSLMGRRCTIIARIYPKGVGSPSEIYYYSNVLLNMPPLSYGNDQNANIEIQAEGNFSILAVFTAVKP